MLRLAALCLALLFNGEAALAQTPEPESEPPPTEEADRDCFGVNEIRGWGIIDAGTVRVRVNSQRMYALTTDRSARRLRWSIGILLTSPSGWICVGDTPAQAQIHDVGQAIPHTWFVQSVRALPVERTAEGERPTAAGEEQPPSQ